MGLNRNTRPRHNKTRDHQQTIEITQPFHPLFPSSGKTTFNVLWSILFFCFLFWGKQSLLKFRHPARTLPGRMHWKLANKLPRLRMFQSLDVKYRKKFKSDLKQKKKILTTMIVLELMKSFRHHSTATFFFSLSSEKWGNASQKSPF